MDALVTCIYNGLSNTKFGGRNCRDERYRESLVTIAATGVPIFCFTSHRDYEKLLAFFQEKNVNNIHLIVLELEELPYHLDIQRIKETNSEKFNDLFWSQRCVEIMWGKLHMIKHVLINNLEIENLFWIDAGLCHNDVISPKYSLKSDIEQKITTRAWALFNHRFMQSLKNFCDGKFLLIEATVPHNTPIPAKYNNNPYRNHNGVVGGLFGGNKEHLLFVHDEFFNKVKSIVQDDNLYGEENILFGILTDHPDRFKTFEFSTWYHEGWADWHNPRAINFSNFFDFISQNEILEDQIIFTTVAMGEKYRELSKNFISTFLNYVKDFKLVILTDDINYYNYVESSNIIFKELKINAPSGYFPYNIKYKAISMTHDIFYNANTIFYLDADCYFEKDIYKDYFDSVKDGLNVVLGTHFSNIQHPSIIQKINTLTLNDEEKDINSFRECSLLFKISNKYNFNKFLIEWELIYKQIEENKLVHVGEFSDITLAAKRADIPINNIERNDLYYLRETIYTTVQNTAVRAIL